MSEPFLGQVKLPFGMGRIPGWVVLPVIVIGIGLPAGFILYNGSPPWGPAPAPGPGPVPTAPPGVCGDGELGLFEQCEPEICYETTLSTIYSEICLDNVGCDPSEVCNPSTCFCQPENTCGNGVVEPNVGETCETNNMTACLSTQECIDCNCYFIAEPAPWCGNNVAEGDEECDGTDNDACQVGEICTSDCQCAFAIPVPEEPHEEVPEIPPQDAPEYPPDPCIGAARVEILDVYDCSFDFDNNRWLYYEGKRCYDEAGNMTYDARNSEAKISEVWLSFCPNPLGNPDEEPQEPGGRNPFSGP